MKTFDVINYHITNRCNYHCTYCFGKFVGQRDPSLTEAKAVIDNIRSYFISSGTENGRINFAGGEPLCFPGLDEVIAYSHAAGLAVSIVTNGSLLTPEHIRSWQGKVSCIGLSIDSVEPETNRTIGRCQHGNTISLPRLIELAEVIHQCGIKLKINTVVSGLNLRESLAPLYRAVKPEKIKLFQMHLVGGINDHAAAYAITEEQYHSFVSRHKASGLVIVEEPAGSMENSYLMVNPEGCFQLNDNGVYHTYGNLRAEALTEILKRVPLDGMRYESRYAREDNG